MDVISRAIDLIESAIFIFNDAPDVLIKFYFVIYIDCGLTIFSAKYDVIVDLTVTAHGIYF